MKTEDERKVEFLLGLAKLTRETGIVVDGCGCCGSPSLYNADQGTLQSASAGYGYGYAGEVAWISPVDAHAWEKYKDSIPAKEGPC